MRFIPSLAALSATVFILSSVSAREEERGGRNRPTRVTFYQDADFRGSSLVLTAGDDIENLAQMQFANGAGANDQITSVRIEGSLEVIVYRDSRYRGGSLRLTGDVRNLGKDGRQWNDIVSSIHIEKRRGSDASDQARFDHAIEQAYRDVLQRSPDKSGLRTYRTRMIEEGWTERELRDALRQSAEYRTVVDRIVSKAYRDVLGREVDPDGLRSYAENMLRNSWTEADVRNALRKSDEYRDRPSHDR